MKKIIFVLAMFLFVAACFAGQVNIIMKDGIIKTGELLGSDEEAYYIKGSNGKAETIMRSKIKKVFDKAGGTAAPKVTSKVKTKSPAVTKKAKKIVVEAAPYKVLETGTDKIKPDYFQKSDDNYIMVEMDIVAFESAFLGKEFKDDYDIASDLLLNYNVGTGVLIRPFDWFAFGIYFSMDLPMIGLTNAAEAEVASISFMKMGGILRWIPYSTSEDELVYFDFRAGARKTIFESKINKVGEINIDVPEFRILLGVSPAFKIGYTFCPATYTIVKESGTESGSIDLSGPFVSFTMIM